MDGTWIFWLVLAGLVIWGASQLIAHVNRRNEVRWQNSRDRQDALMRDIANLCDSKELEVNRHMLVGRIEPPTSEAEKARVLVDLPCADRSRLSVGEVGALTANAHTLFGSVARFRIPREWREWPNVQESLAQDVEIVEQGEELSKTGGSTCWTLSEYRVLSNSIERAHLLQQVQEMTQS